MAETTQAIFRLLTLLLSRGSEVLLPRIAPLEKLKDYMTMKSCVKWLGNLAGRTDWKEEMEMEAVQSDYSKGVIQRHETLF